MSGASAAPLSPLPLPPGLPPEGNFEGARKMLTRSIEKMEANGGGGGAAAEGAESVNGQAAAAAAAAGTAAMSGNLAAAGGVTKRVTEQNGPRGEGALTDVLLWNESAVAKSMGCRLVLTDGVSRSAHQRNVRLGLTDGSWSAHEENFR